MVWILTDPQRLCWSLGPQLTVLLKPLEARPGWRKLGHWIIALKREGTGAPAFSNSCFLFWLKLENSFPLPCASIIFCLATGSKQPRMETSETMNQSKPLFYFICMLFYYLSLLLSFYYFFSLYFYLYAVLPACMSVYHVCAMPTEARRGTLWLGT